MKKLIQGLFLFALVLFAALYGFQEYVFRKQIDPEIAKTRELQRKHLHEYLEDRRILSGLEVLGPGKRTKDAGTYLNAKLSWKLEEGNAFLKGWNSGPSSLVLPAHVLGNLRAWKADFIAHRGETNLQSLDFSWLKAIESFDYWDLDHNSPIERLYLERVQSGKMDPLIFSMTRPVVNFEDLVAWTKLRWMKAFSEGSFESASRESQRLVRLLFATENLPASLIGVGVLNIENIAYQAAIALGIPIGNWKAPGAEIVGRLKRFIMGGVSYFSGVSEEAMLRKVFMEAPLLVTVCSAIGEGIRTQAFSRSLVTGGLPLERDFGGAFGILDEIFERHKSSCRFSYLELVWKTGFPERLLASEEGRKGLGNVSPLLTLPLFPYVRKAVGGSMLSIGTPMYLNRYDAPLRH